MNLEGGIDLESVPPRHLTTVNRRKARAPKRAASGDDAKLFGRHRQDPLPEQPRLQPQQQLFQGRGPQSLAAMRRLKNAQPAEVLEGKRMRHASTWLNEFVKDLPQSPNKEGDHTERRGSRGSSSEPYSSPLEALQRLQSLGPPNAEFLGLGPVPKKRRSAPAGANRTLFSVKTEDSKLQSGQALQLPSATGDEPDTDAFTAVRHALHVQQGKTQVVVKAQHVQQLLDTLKTFQAFLGCQGMAAQQGKLQLDHNAATSKTTKARESLTSTLPSKPSVFTGTKQQDAESGNAVLAGFSLQHLLRPTSSLAASPADQRAPSAHPTSNASGISQPPFLEQFRSLGSFERLTSKGPSSKACIGIRVPVQQSLPPMHRAEHRIHADGHTGHMGRANGHAEHRAAHPASAASEDHGRPPSCRPITRSGQPPAGGGPLIGTAAAAN